MTGKPRGRTRQTANNNGDSSKASAAQAPTATDGQGEPEGRPSDLLSPPPGSTLPNAPTANDMEEQPPSPMFSQDLRDKDERAADDTLKSPVPRLTTAALASPKYPGGYAPNLSSLGGADPYATYQPGYHLSSFVDQNDHLRAKGHDPGDVSRTAGTLRPPVIITTDTDLGEFFIFPGTEPPSLRQRAD
jgi:hypothetical protein